MTTTVHIVAGSHLARAVFLELALAGQDNLVLEVTGEVDANVADRFPTQTVVHGTRALLIVEPEGELVEKFFAELPTKAAVEKVLTKISGAKTDAALGKISQKDWETVFAAARVGGLLRIGAPPVADEAVTDDPPLNPVPT